MVSVASLNSSTQQVKQTGHDFGHGSVVCLLQIIPSSSGLPDKLVLHLRLLAGCRHGRFCDSQSPSSLRCSHKHLKNHFCCGDGVFWFIVNVFIFNIILKKKVRQPNAELNASKRESIHHGVMSWLQIQSFIQSMGKCLTFFSHSVNLTALNQSF